MTWILYIITTQQWLVSNFLQFVHLGARRTSNQTFFWMAQRQQACKPNTAKLLSNLQVFHRLSYNRKWWMHNSSLCTNSTAQDNEDKDIGMEIHANQNMRGVLVVIQAQCESAPPPVDGVSAKSICFWPLLADWREPMEWDLIWCQTEHLDEAACMDFVWVPVHARLLDPVLQLMVFMCILVRACAQSQVWVTVSGQNGKTGAGFDW